MARITETQIARELTALEDIIRARPEGSTRPEIEAEIRLSTGQTMPERTVARRLARLVAAGLVRMERKARNTRYYPTTSAASTTGITPYGELGTGSWAVATSGQAGEASDDYVPLSSDSEEVRDLVHRPLSARQPVGYHADFLERYEPGISWYLPPELRARMHDTGRTPDGPRPAGTYAREILSQLLIDLSWGSSRLEGNTYSRLDTRNLIEFGQQAEGKNAREAQMILNHRAAIEMLVEDVEQIGFNRYTFLNLHAALSENLLDDSNDEGGLRERLVGIEGSTYTPTGIPQKIEEYFDLFLQKAAAIPDPFEQAFFVLVQLPYLQPFADVNKRTSRLGANISLIRDNLFPLSFIDVPERAYVDGLLGVYEMNRIELLRDVFAWAYERSARQYQVLRDSMGDPDPLRLRYRTELREAVRDTVLGDEPPRREILRAWAEAHEVARSDVDAFSELALQLLLALHEGALARYRLRPSEFLRWRARHAAPSAAR